MPPVRRVWDARHRADAHLPASIDPRREWKDGLLRFSFWSLNGGLMAMCVLSLLPVGLMQTWASVEHGYWYARSSEFMQTDLMQTLRWMRVPGDTCSSSEPWPSCFVCRRSEDRALVQELEARTLARLAVIVGGIVYQMRFAPVTVQGIFPNTSDD
jgi:hypothetical protein